MQGVGQVNTFNAEKNMYYCRTPINRKTSDGDKICKCKIKRFDVRVPHDIANSVEELKEEGESIGQFVVSALQGEIKRRQRKKAKLTD